MLPDKIVSVSMSFSPESADLVAVVTDPLTGIGLSKEWTTTAVPPHTDNDWHVVRDLLIDWIGEAF